MRLENHHQHTAKLLMSHGFSLTIGRSFDWSLPMKPKADIRAFLGGGFICLMLCGVCLVGVLPPANANEPRIVNIYNFVRNSDYRVANSEDVLYETTRQQIQLLKQAGLPATWALQYDALINPRYQKLFKEQLDPMTRSRPGGKFRGLWLKRPACNGGAGTSGIRPPISAFLQATRRKNGASWWTSICRISRQSLVIIPAPPAHGILMRSPWLTWSSVMALWLPAIARIRLARTATRCGAAIGTKPTIRADLTRICRHRPRQGRLMCRSLGCWAAILYINMAVHQACPRLNRFIQRREARRTGWHRSWTI